MVRPSLVFVLLLLICFSLSAWLQPRYEARMSRGIESDSALGELLGDGRQMVADSLHTEADVYFHSGYYPSIFDQARMEDEKDADVSHPEETNAPPEEGFLGPPQDWIDRFSRHFRPTRHTHLHGQEVAEILPWMSLSAELDPHRIETYLTTSYFLRNYLGKLDEDKAFLHLGLRANPDSPDLKLELGRLYFENYKDLPHAKNVWLGAVKSWYKVEGPKPERTPTGEGQRDTYLLGKIYDSLANEELQAGHTNEAIAYFEQSKTNSPFSGKVQKHIDQLRAALQTGGDHGNHP